LPDAAVDGFVADLASDIASLDPHLLRHIKIAMTEIERGDPLGGHAVEQRYTALLRARTKVHST
jgi:hypothetical protein